MAYRADEIYSDNIGLVTKTQENWKAILKMASNLYRFEFDNILLIYAQKPGATLVADFDTWKKVDRYVKRGSKGIAIFRSQALKPNIRYVFDISDTNGKDKALTWSLDGNEMEQYAAYLSDTGVLQDYESKGRENAKNSLKMFTGTNVWFIITEEFGDRLLELKQLTGSMISEFSEKREGLPDTRSDIENLIYQSVMYEVGTRCGFDLNILVR